MYTIGEAAERAGVSVDLLRAWERRYAIVNPDRTAGGYRLYDDGAIARLRAMRTLVDDGWTPSAAAGSLRDLEVSALPVPSIPPPPADDGADLSADFVDAARVMDAGGVRAVLDEMGARASFEGAMERYLFPALRGLGDAWEAGLVSVAAEHAASNAVARWLGAAFEAAGGGLSREGAVLIGLPSGARHELGALAFATAARRAGVPVHYLGADVPADDWSGAASATRAGAAVIGVPTAADRPAARTTGSSLVSQHPDLLVAFGGPAARRMRGVGVLPESLVAAVEELKARMGQRN